MRLYDLYVELGGKRTLPLKNIEAYHPPLFLRRVFRFETSTGDKRTIRGEDMTNEMFWEYMDYIKDPSKDKVVNKVRYSYWKENENEL